MENNSSSYYNRPIYNNRYDNRYDNRYLGGIGSKGSVTSKGSVVSTKTSSGRTSNGTRSTSSTISPGSYEEIFEYVITDGKLYRNTIHIINVTPFRADGPTPRIKYERSIVKSEMIDSSNSFECIVCGLQDEGQLIAAQIANKSLDMNSAMAKYDSFLKSIVTLQKKYPAKHDEVYMLVRFITYTIAKSAHFRATGNLTLPEYEPSEFTQYYIKNYPDIISELYKSSIHRMSDEANALTGYINIASCTGVCIVLGEEKVSGGTVTHYIEGGYNRKAYNYYPNGGYNRNYYSRGGYDRDYYSRGGYNRNYYSRRGGYRDYYPNSMHGGALGEFRSEINRYVYENLRDTILNIELD